MRPITVCAAAIILSLSILVSGCGTTMCPAIGWFNTVNVQLDVSDAARIELCAEAKCTSHGDHQDAQESTPYSVERVSESSWKVRLGMSTPDHAVIRAFSPSDHLLARERVTLDWARVGGTEECGGPHQADVTISIQ